MTTNVESLQAKLEALEEAIYSGALEIEYEGRRIKYKSGTDMMNARSLLRKKLGLDRKIKRVVVASKKDL